jgi:ABC-type glutathione transport system ATPase component
VLLEVRDLTVRYGPEAAEPAVDGVSFGLAEGESVGLVGESGAGKTTIGQALLGVLPPQARVSGSVRWRGRELLGLDEAEWRGVRGAQIGIVFQEPALALNPVRRVGWQVAEVVRAHRPGSSRRHRAEAEEALALVHAADLYDAYPHELSGGQRQRVLLAQAIACRPALLVADEPTAFLDPVLEWQVLELVLELRAQLRVALLLVSHDLGSHAALADRLLVLHGGRLVESGTTEAVYRQPTHPYSRGLLECWRARGGGRVHGG